MPDVGSLEPDEFLSWVDGCDAEQLADGLCRLTDGQRRKLSKTVAAAHRKLGSVAGVAARDWRLALTLVGVCPWGDVRRFHSRELKWGVYDARDDLFEKVLAARGPELVKRWVESELELEWTNWTFLRRLVRSGACPRPDGDAYIVRMVRSRLDAWGRDSPALADQLKADPGLLEEEIWRIFEVDPAEGGLFIYDESSWGATSPGSSSWGPTLVRLASEGVLDRFRLLRSSLETLRRGIQLKDVAFHMRLVERLAPTEEEERLLAEHYVDLLTHRADSVVKFAADSAVGLVKRGAIEPAAVIDRLTSALQREAKSPAEAALRLLRTVAKKDPGSKSAAARRALDGLAHPKPEIHARVIAFVQEFAAGDPETLALLGGQAERIAPSQRSKVRKADEEGAAETGEAITLDAWLARARAVPDEWRLLAGLDALAADLEHGVWPPAWVPPEDRVPRLDGGAVVRPVESLEETVDLLLRLLESAEDSIVLERALDGVSRFAAQPSADFRERTAALLQRAKTPHAGMSEGSYVAFVLSWLVRVWLAREEPPPLFRSPAPEMFLAERVREIAMRILRGVSEPLLALPTHGAWLDPRALVARLAGQASRRTRAATADLVQALLRLAPEGRAEALAAASELPQDSGSVVRYALGGDAAGLDLPASGWKNFLRIGFGSRAETRWPVWAAAARTRGPSADAPDLYGTPCEELFWGARAVSYAWGPAVKKPHSWSAAEPRIEFRWSPRLERAPAAEWPPDLLAASVRGWTNTTADVRHRQTLWPANPTLLFAEGTDSVCDRLFRNASTFTPTAAYLEPLLDPDTAFTPAAQVLVALALVAQDADARTMALDVGIRLIEDGRCRGDELGAVFTRLLAAKGFVKLGRLAESVASLAAAGPLQREAARRLLAEVLAVLTASKDVHHLLSVYRELLAEDGRPCDPRARPLLASIGGSGKTARLARELLDLESPAELPRELASRLVRARLDRIEVWRRRLASSGSSI